MLFPRFSRRSYGRQAGVVALLLLCGLIAGCATSGKVAQRGADGQISKPARLKVDGKRGFTVTEVVRISGEVRSNYQKALALLQRDELDAGIELLEKVTSKAPGITAPYIDLGIAYGLAGDYEKAEHRLKAALKLAPAHPVVLNELGIVYRKTGRFEAARRSYEAALAVHPGFHYARRNLGVLCDLYLEDLACALQHYEMYNAIVPGDEFVSMWMVDVRNRHQTPQ